MNLDSVHKTARPVIGHNLEFLSGSQEERNAGMAYETTAAGRHKNPFLLSSLPAFLRGSGETIVKATLFGCGHAALVSGSSHIRADGIQSLVDPKISSIDLFNIMNNALAVGRHRSNQQSDAGPDIRCAHDGRAQLQTAAQTDDSGTMRIAEDDLSTHVDQFVDKE